MKNLLKFTLSLIAFLCLSQVVSAQMVNQGAWMVGGSASFTSESIKDVDESSTTIILNPNLGYFLADDLALGINLNVTSFDDNTEFSVGPYLRYYFADALFAQAGVNLGLGDSEFTEFGLGVGYSWFIGNDVAIEPMVFYRSYSSDFFDASRFGLSIGVQAFAGRTSME